MVKETFQNLGTSWAIAISGENEREILEAYYSYFNNGGTSGDLIWLNEGRFGYFWTDIGRILSAMENAALAKILNGQHPYKGKKGGAIATARRMAKERFASMEQETFVPPEYVNGYYYALGQNPRDPED